MGSLDQTPHMQQLSMPLTQEDSAGMAPGLTPAPAP